MPDTAEQEWLDRHGIIWLTNTRRIEGTQGRNLRQRHDAIHGRPRTAIPIGSCWVAGDRTSAIPNDTAGMIGIDGLGIAEADGIATRARSATCQSGSNMDPAPAVPGIDKRRCLGDMIGRRRHRNRRAVARTYLVADTEPADGRIADGLRQLGDGGAWSDPRVGGAGDWTRHHDGRFLMDDLYPENYGLPQEADIEAVFDYVNSKRPVTVLDCFVMAPILYFYDVTIRELTKDDATTRGNRGVNQGHGV